MSEPLEARADEGGQVGSPLRRYASRAVKFEKPPTKKKIGITCKAQVASQSHALTPTALVVVITPPSQTRTR